jgi:cysteinyl-tRNA synthetase
MSLKIYNSLSRKAETFKPEKPELITMYTCGPTVYDFAHIGNWRTYVLSDIVNRVLKFNNYKVKFVMNLTDVGHLTGDNLGDTDMGEDRLEAAAEKEGRSARDVANYYIDDFLKNYDKINLLKPSKFTRATEYIQEQIELVKDLEKKGFTYRTSDGVYFDTSKYKKYGQLSGRTEESVQEEAREGAEEGARLEPNPEKKNPADFALWRFSPPDKIRWQEWESPWGVGFPGWHIECSAMSIKELGVPIDIHIGAEDLKMTHHQNEIAQSESVTGETFVNYWIHGAFLLVDGGRMGKSLGNAYTIADVEARSFDPIALRYFYMTAHYRTPLNFTWEALQNVQNSLKKLYDIVGSYREEKDAPLEDEYMEKFMEAINDDFNMPKAIAVLWELLKADLDESVKIKNLLEFDEVLGLNIENYIGFDIPQKVLDLVKIRQEYRRSGIWDKADSVRRQIADLGYLVEDTEDGYKLRRKL